MKRILELVLGMAAVFSLTFASAAPKEYKLSSPDGKIEVTVTASKTLTYSITRDGKTVLAPSRIAMSLQDGSVVWGDNARFSVKRNSVNETIASPSHRHKTVDVNYNELDLRSQKFGVQFRAFDDGVAYRFYTNANNPSYKVSEEVAEFNFDKDYTAYLPYSRDKKNPFHDSFEQPYKVTPISEFDTTNTVFLPVLVDLKDAGKVLIMESDLESYAGMILDYDADKGGFKGLFPKYPKSFTRGTTRCKNFVKDTYDYIARFDGARTFPWRVLAIVENDAQLPTNDLVYALASPCRIDDTSWIKPGKSAWDWWNNWGISNVDFKAGINTETYKYFVDFAADNGLQYIILDEGWSPPAEGDVMNIRPEVDLKEIASYAKSKGIGVIIWVVGNVLDEKLEEACKTYSEMGISGYKVDFIDRTDQQAVEMVYRIAEVAAKYGMLVDYHGIYKPTGLSRTYPNVVNYEGVFGLEQLKWSNPNMPLYDVTMPFIRMVPGPVDYTQGAMRNANKSNFRDIYSTPMSQGTRAHQVATYVVFDSPLVMLCDTPTNYIAEPEVTSFIARMPQDADKTVVLQGKVGEFIVTARRVGSDWYVGGLTSWTGRDLQLPLDFLSDGEYTAEIMTDGVNASRIGEDYKLETRSVDKSSVLNVKMAGGGGFAMIITKK